MVLGAGGFVWLRSGPTPSDRVPITDFRLDVPAGPGQPGTGPNDTVSLDATLYLPERTPAPAVLLAHGFGGSKASVDADARDLAVRGYVVLAWSARGFGGSTGRIALNSPTAEVADGSRLLDYLATRPEVLLDGPGDPRAGVTGASYGGALSLLLAGYDRRVDAIAPLITWNDLGQALFPNAAAGVAPPVDTPARGAFGPDGVFKRGWAGIFFASGLSPRPAGAPTASPAATSGDPTADDDGTADAAGAPPAGSTPGAAAGPPLPAAPAPGAPAPGTPASGGATASAPGSPAPGAPAEATTCGRFVPEVCTAYARDAASGRIDPGTAALLRRSSPVSVADRITAPTLLVQGESDTLFGLDQADATARQIAGSGGTVRVLWYSGGHDGGAPGPAIREQIGDWFDRYLARDPAADPVDTAPGGLSYAVQSGIRTGGRNSNSTPTVRTVDADRYPGLAGDPVQTVGLALHGDAQSVINPPGGYPAAITSVPGVSGSLGSLAGRLSALATDLPGQAATFASDPLARQLVVAGASRVRLTVAPVPGQPSAADAVLFVRQMEVSGDGRRTLLGGAVAPIRVPMPAGGGPAEVTVTLPGVVAPIESGHRLVLSVSTTDQSYLGPPAPAVWKVALSGDPRLAVPVVPGQAVSRYTVPTGPAVGIGVILVGALAAVVLARVLRHRRLAAEDRDPGPDADLPLVVDGLAKRYPGGITAVNGVSFRVRPNQVVGLLGPNGAGKTTVLRMLMGLLLPSSGELRVFGHPVGPGAPVLSRIGSFVEGPGFLPHLSGRRNLELYWAATGRPEADARFAEALDIAGLGAAVDRAVRTYSQGMRQRLAIAQAMLGLPDLLVLDEPTNGLDPPQIHAMREVLRGYARDGRSVLVSSHLLAEVEQSCDHVVVMHRGRVVADGAVTEIVAGGGAASFRVSDARRAARVLDEIASVRGVEVDGDLVHAELNGMARSEAVGHLVRAGVSVESVGPRRRLEDAFLQLVGEDTAP